MRQHRRFKSINFILWVSFLAFAAFILILTWVFQITLLRFLTVQVKDELESFGRDLSDAGKNVAAVLAGDRRLYPLKENDNRATDIFILNLEDRGKLHPSSEDGQLVTGVASISSKGQEKLADSPFWGQRHRQIWLSYVYAAKMAMMTAGSPEVTDVCLYISYSPFSRIRPWAICSCNSCSFRSSSFCRPDHFWIVVDGTYQAFSQISRAAKRMATGDYSVDFRRSIPMRK
ncbi:MAG: hypothetical protein ACLRTQ_06725 [Candidatus Borkfalkia sp.]